MIGHTKLLGLSGVEAAGVWILFTISGYLLAKSVSEIRSFADCASLFLGRIKRIAPLYILTVVFLCSPLNDDPLDFLFRNIFLQYGDGHLWSIKQGALLYLTVSVLLIAFLLITESVVTIFFTLLIIAGVHYFFLFGHFLVAANGGVSPIFSLPFILGASVAYLEKIRFALFESYPYVLRIIADVVFATFIVLVFSSTEDLGGWLGPLGVKLPLTKSAWPYWQYYSVISALILYFIVKGRGLLILQALSSLPLRFLGLLAYSLYLLHFPITIYYFKYLPPGVPIFLVVLALTVVLAIFTYVFVERAFWEPRDILTSQTCGELPQEWRTHHVGDFVDGYIKTATSKSLIVHIAIVAVLVVLPQVRFFLSNGVSGYQSLVLLFLSIMEYYLVFVLLSGIVMDFGSSRSIRSYLYAGLALTVMSIYAAQGFSLWVSNNYITEMAIGNVDFFRVLDGRSVIFTLAILCCSWFFFLKYAFRSRADFAWFYPKGHKLLFAGGFVLAAILSNAPTVQKAGVQLGIGLTPLTAFLTTSISTPAYRLIARALSNSPVMSSTIKKDFVFSKETVFERELPNDHFAKSPKAKNVIIVFVEGTTARMLGAYGGTHEGLTPNLDRVASEWIRVENFFNHTAATYRGIHGQLTSSYHKMEKVVGDEGGYWKDKDSENCVNFQSLVSVLRSKGYETVFLHPDPFNDNFHLMLRSLGFESVFSEDLIVEKLLHRPGTHVKTLYLSDKDVIDGAISYLKSKETSDRNLFLSWYMIGTHAFWNVTPAGYKYGDGSNSALNRLHNADLELGRFFEYFRNSKYSSDTILIVTADHSAYPEPDTVSACKSPLCSSYFVDEVPFIVYVPNLRQPIVLNAYGRNSLSVAPTVLHILNIKNVQNSFLGSSLFESESAPPISAIGEDFFATGPDGTWLLSKDGSFKTNGKGLSSRYEKRDSKKIVDKIGSIMSFYRAIDRNAVSPNRDNCANLSERR
jgi:peptidoglycan/LPS O-acetylase OafA/YrhL